MIRQIVDRRMTIAVALTGWAAAALLGAAAGNFFAVSDLLVLAALGAPLFVAVYLLPPLGLLFGVLFPLLSNALGNSVVLPVGLLLIGLGAVRSFPGSSRRSRRAAGLIVLLGGLTLIIGIVLAETSGPSQGRGLAVVYATALGIAAALGTQSVYTIGLCLWAVALPMAILAFGSPALRVDRTSTVLGENANGVGVLAALGCVAAVAMIREGPRPLRLLAVPVSVVCTVGLLVTGSRGALAVLLVGALTALVWTRSGRASGRRILALVVGAAVAISYSDELLARFLEFAGRSVLVGDSPLGGRLSLLPFALEQGLSHPLRGVGLGQLGTVGASVSGYRVDQRAHNAYIGAFAEAGVLVAALLVLVSVLALRRAWTSDRLIGLPLATAAVTVGMSLEWWGSGVTGAVVMLIIGACLGAPAPEHSADALSSSGSGRTDYNRVRRRRSSTHRE